MQKIVSIEKNTWKTINLSYVKLIRNSNNRITSSKPKNVSWYDSLIKS